MDRPIDTTGRSMAAAFYGLILAPLGERMGTMGGLFVQEAAVTEAASPHDAAGQYFAHLLTAPAVPK